MSYLVEKDWTTAAGLRAVIIICKSAERMTHRCGYVGVPSEHKFYGKDYGEPLDCITQFKADHATLGNKSPILMLTATVGGETENSIRRALDIVVEVHGGLTYSGGNNTYPVQANLWWFGFDCHHYGDADIEPDPRWSAFRNGEVRSLEYTAAECERLAEQLEALAA